MLPDPGGGHKVHPCRGSAWLGLPRVEEKELPHCSCPDTQPLPCPDTKPPGRRSLQVPGGTGRLRGGWMHGGPGSCAPPSLQCIATSPAFGEGELQAARSHGGAIKSCIHVPLSRNVHPIALFCPVPQVCLYPKPCFARSSGCGGWGVGMMEWERKPLRGEKASYSRVLLCILCIFAGCSCGG